MLYYYFHFYDIYIIIIYYFHILCLFVAKENILFFGVCVFAELIFMQIHQSQHNLAVGRKKATKHHFE